MAQESQPGQHAAMPAADASGTIQWPGAADEGRAPGSALLLVVLSFVTGGLLVWHFWPQMARFDWIAALTLRSTTLAVLGGAILVLGGAVLLRHGLIWGVRTGAVIAVLAMVPILRAGAVGGGMSAFLGGAAPAVLLLLLSASPSLRRWRHRRRTAVAVDQVLRPVLDEARRQPGQPH